MGSDRMHWFSTSLYDDPQAAHQLDHVTDDPLNGDTAESRSMNDTPTRTFSAHDPATAERSTVHRGPLPERDSATDARARVEATARRPARRSRARRLGAALPLALLAGDLAALVIASAVLGGEWDAAAVFAVLTLVTRAAARQYRPRLSLSMLDDIPRVLGSLVAAVGLSALVMVALGSEHISTVVLLQRAAVFLAASLVLQAVVVSVSRRRRLGHEAGRRTLVVGGGRVGATIVDALIEHPELGLRPVGVAEPGARPRLVRHDEVPVLANDMEQLADTVVNSKIDATILAMGDGDAHVDTVIALHQTGCEIFLVPSMFEMHHDGPDVERVRGVPMIRLRPDPTQRLSWWIKRGVDIAVASIGLLVLSVPLAIVALLVLVDSGRPIMFWQERVGLDGRRCSGCASSAACARASEAESQTQWNIAVRPPCRP